MAMMMAMMMTAMIIMIMIYDDDADDDDCDCCCGLRGFQYALQSCPYGMSTSILVAAVATFLAAISSPVQVKLMMPMP